MHNSNGYTIVEMMVVLLIVSMCTLVFTSMPRANSLHMIADTILYKCCIVQEQAFYQKQNKYVTIGTYQANFDKETLIYPHGITCEPASFSYNAKGNISQANTVKCFEADQHISLVFQLGSGRVRVDD